MPHMNLESHFASARPPPPRSLSTFRLCGTEGVESGPARRSPLSLTRTVLFFSQAPWERSPGMRYGGCVHSRKGRNSRRQREIMGTPATPGWRVSPCYLFFFKHKYLNTIILLLKYYIIYTLHHTIYYYINFL